MYSVDAVTRITFQRREVVGILLEDSLNQVILDDFVTSSITRTRCLFVASKMGGGGYLRGMVAKASKD